MFTLNIVVTIWTAIVFYLVFQSTQKGQLVQTKNIGFLINYGPFISVGYIAMLAALVLLPYVIEAVELIVASYRGDYLINILVGSSAIWGDLRTTSLQKLAAWPFAVAISTHFLALAIGRLSCKFNR